ncbi:MAG: SPASM domain-containing protein [Bacteroidia bacterium]|nr:SPASM domain-containing protein [Bacteroidia bacterium]
MSFTENIRILKTLNGKKISNAYKVFRSYKKSLRNGTSFHAGFPISISFEPTTSCNLRCPECPSGLRNFTRPTGMLEENFFQKTIDELSPHLVYLTFYFQGEPYLNPKFLDMAAYAAKKKIYTATSTNAHFITDETAKKTIESGLHRLIISIDGATQKSYEQYRIGGQLEKVIAGTKKIIEWKKKLKSKTPYVIFQFLVVKPNEHETEEIIKLGNELGVDEVKFKTAQVYDFENGNTLIPETEKFSRYKKNENGKWGIKNKLLNQCWRMWSGCVITWDGLVVPCCFDKDATHKLGDLKSNSFEKVWKSEGYEKFRSSILRSRGEIDICKNCTEGTEVWAES